MQGLFSCWKISSLVGNWASLIGRMFCRTIYWHVWISFALGLAIASYEWMAAITLLIVGKYLPIFIEKGLYTIPEFIEKRFNTELKTILAIFWITICICKSNNCFMLGRLALDTVMGTGDGSILINTIIGLALFAAAYSLWSCSYCLDWCCSGSCFNFWRFDDDIFCFEQLRRWRICIRRFKICLWNCSERFSMILSREEIITPNGKDAWFDS